MCKHLSIFAHGWQLTRSTSRNLNIVTDTLYIKGEPIGRGIFSRTVSSFASRNRTAHIKALQQEGYVSVAKSFQNNRPLTTCALTVVGRKAFAEYINLLEKIVRQNKPK